jgi:hypothetical protein
MVIRAVLRIHDSQSSVILMFFNETEPEVLLFFKELELVAL